jgi:hypothetical protein
LANPRESAWARLVSQGLQVSQQQASRALQRLRVSEALATTEAKRAFQREPLYRIGRSQKQLLSRRPERLLDPPSVSARLPAAVKGAI